MVETEFQGWHLFADLLTLGTLLLYMLLTHSGAIYHRFDCHAKSREEYLTVRGARGRGGHASLWAALGRSAPPGPL